MKKTGMLASLRNTFYDLDERLAAKIDLSRRFKGYFPAPVLWFAFILIAALFVLVGFENSWSGGKYVSCDRAVPCLNPLYDAEKCSAGVGVDPFLCTPVLQPGAFIGKKPGFLYYNFEWLALCILLLSFIGHHINYKIRSARQ